MPRDLRGTWPIVTILLLIAAACLYLWRATSMTDFGLNAFTETLGIIITVVIVERLIRRQEARRTLPLESAAYADIRLLVVRVADLWMTMFRHSVPEASPTTLDELLSEETFEKIGSHLDIEAEAPTIPRRPWHQYLTDKAREEKQLAEQILERYVTVLDPEAYLLVHEINSSLFGNGGLSLVARMRRANSEVGAIPPSTLRMHLTRCEDLGFSSILALNRWCLEAEQNLRRRGVSNIWPAEVRFSNEGPQASPSSMLPRDELARQIKEFEAFQERAREQAAEARRD